MQHSLNGLSNKMQNRVLVQVTSGMQATGFYYFTILLDVGILNEYSKNEFTFLTHGKFSYTLRGKNSYEMTDKVTNCFVFLSLLSVLYYCHRLSAQLQLTNISHRK